MRYDQYREQFLKALSQQDWQNVVLNATELIKIDDTEPMVWTNRGVGLQKLGFPLDAILSYDRASLLRNLPEQVAAIYANKGAAYWDMHNDREALKWLDVAVEIAPLNEAYLTMANVYKHRGNLKRAIECYRLSAANSDYADGHMALGMALIKAGQLKEGWQEYAWRWKTNQLPPRKLKCPKWDGQDLTDKTILVYGEQGLGDIIQFSRYAALLARQHPTAKVIVEGRPPLKRLLETLPGVYAVINAGERLPELDYGISMIDLTALLTPDIKSIVSYDRLFKLDNWDVEAWRERLKPLTIVNPNALKVGICWAGMSRDAHPHAAAVDVLRSTSFQTFAPLAKIDDILWVSLQKGPPAQQLREGPSIGMKIGDFTEDMHDFYETCCAMENCDLIISVDTAVVHAAASIGKPTWLLSRWDGCWRWFGDRITSPWYPSLAQFVQPKPGDWETMMKLVAQELTLRVKSQKQPELNLTMAK